MSKKVYQLSLDFDQILKLVEQLSESEKIKLSKELEKKLREQKLTELLQAFETDDLSLEEITEEVETVRFDWKTND
ncbi:type II toxin-antitoxin system VapB15 family antitoxin [Dactylococcopsis salina]|uniref:Uncharacterized protein n=1 Tax=Dactylococcopsis salina (strain PCC 8305) TaxID=13035 RepID=K9YSS8_DACS8|nr:hypothetical protein [Dactylococcopsis salina]AFZ49400.1 hypothetical protein Dacsa_0626 [Dactylococcopsis salina PCC 8305]